MFIANFYNGSLELDVQIHSACNRSKLLLFFYVDLKVWKFNSAIDLVYLGLPWDAYLHLKKLCCHFCDIASVPPVAICLDTRFKHAPLMETKV